MPDDGFQLFRFAPAHIAQINLVMEPVRPKILPHIYLSAGHRRVQGEGPRQGIEPQKLTVYYSPQCPYIHQSVELVRKTCEELETPYTLVSVDTLEKAKSLPCVFNNWAVFYRGKFVTVNLLDAAALKRLLKK